MAGLTIKYTYINEDGVETKGSKTLPGGTSALCTDRCFTKEELYNILSIIIPNGIRVIACEAFKDCRKLRKVKFPRSLKGIGDSAFLRCESLNNVAIPISVESIGECAFESAKRMKGFIRISPKTEIGFNAFYGNYDRIRYYDS